MIEAEEADKQLIGALIAYRQKMKDELSDLSLTNFQYVKENVTSPTPFIVNNMGEVLNSQPFIEAMDICKGDIEYVDL